jgi:hypothetical protein
VLVVTKPHRLARSALELLRIVDQIGKEGAGFKSLGEPWAGTKPGRPSHADRAVRHCRVRARPDPAANQ